MEKESNDGQKVPDLMLKVADELESSSDLIKTPLQIEEKNATLLFIKTVVDGGRIQDSIIRPFYELASQEHFEAYINSLPNKLEMPSLEQLTIDLTMGKLLIAFGDQCVLLDYRLVHTEDMQDAALEPTIHGPQLGLSEDLETNINIIRHRFNNKSLTVETPQLNDRTHRTISILYDETIVNTRALEMVKQKLDELDMSIIQTSGDLQLYLNDSKFTLFPSTILTGRPDRIVYNLNSGKVILMVDGSPHAILAPVVFFDFMVSMEDNYHTFLISKSTLALRYLGLLTCVLLPGLYIAFTAYNPEVLKIELAISVAGSRLGVPYPSFIEVILMMIFIEFLTESSIRLPTAISGTATTVGGLILGTALVDAGFASNIMIIIVALVAIATFIIPVNEMSFAIRIGRMALVIFSAIFGLIGLTLGLLGSILYLTNKESFGETYLRFYWKDQKQELKGTTK